MFKSLGNDLRRNWVSGIRVVVANISFEKNFLVFLSLVRVHIVDVIVVIAPIGMLVVSIVSTTVLLS